MKRRELLKLGAAALGLSLMSGCIIGGGYDDDDDGIKIKVKKKKKKKKYKKRKRR